MKNTTRKPVAWAIVGEDNMVLDSHIYHTRSVAKRNAKEMQETLVPLYRDPPPPMLTDAEREALKWSIAECEREAVIESSRAQTRNYLDCQLRECQAMSRASTLRDLLARLGGGA